MEACDIFCDTRTTRSGSGKSIRVCGPILQPNHSKELNRHTNPQIVVGVVLVNVIFQQSL
jgi:hypothetical protein